jgi:hypothetical protein
MLVSLLEYLFSKEYCGTVHAYNVETGKWREFANVSPRSAHAMTVVNGSEIVICGGLQYGMILSSCIRLIDPIHNTSAVWQSDIPNMPMFLFHHALFYIDGQLVVFGGDSYDGRRVISACFLPYMHLFEDFI